MDIERIPLRTLKASGQPRPLITEAVDKLAASIREVGLIQPISVRCVPVMDGGVAVDGYQIVAGHHRVAAARALGWTEIDAIIVDAGEHLQAELIEIDENLCRAELTASQRAQAIKRRKQIWEALHPVEKRMRGSMVMESQFDRETGDATCASSLSDGRKAGPQHEKQFAADTASVSGESKSQINRHLARAEAIGEDLERVTGTSLDKGVELDALAKLPELERKELIDKAEAGEQVSARKASAAKQQALDERLCDVIDEAVERILSVMHADSIAEFSEAVNNMPDVPRKRVESALVQLELIGTLCAGVEA